MAIRARLARKLSVLAAVSLSLIGGLAVADDAAAAATPTHVQSRASEIGSGTLDSVAFSSPTPPAT